MPINDFKYKSYNHLDEPVRYVGLTLFDELIPALLFTVMGLGITRSFLGALAFLIAYVVIIKAIKYKKGEYFLMRFLYWRMSKNTSKRVFRHTPPASERFYIGRR